MNQKEMVERCKEKGVNITSALLYRQGKIHGFLVRNDSDGRERYNVIEDKFNEWLNNFNVDSDYVMVCEFAKKHNMAYSALKYHIEKNSIPVEKKGSFHGGMMYAKRADLERIISQCGKRAKE